MGFMDINLTGQSFSDYKLTDVGSDAYQLEHDWFTKEDLVITTGAGGGGTPLSEGVDYQLSEEDEELSERVTAAVGSTRTVYHYITIINATYQTGDLYHSGKYIADSNSAADMNRLRDILEITDQNYTIQSSDNYGLILVTTSAEDRTITPDAASKHKSERLRIMKKDNGSGRVVIGGLSFYLVSQYDFVDIFSDGSNWLIWDFRATYETGWLLNEMAGAGSADWTNVHLGDDPTDPTDYITHGLGVPKRKLFVKVSISTDGMDANSFEVHVGADWGGTDGTRYGITAYCVDNNNIKLQTGQAGISYLNDSGVIAIINAQDWYYNIVVERTRI